MTEYLPPSDRGLNDAILLPDYGDWPIPFDGESWSKDNRKMNALFKRAGEDHRAAATQWDRALVKRLRVLIASLIAIWPSSVLAAPDLINFDTSPTRPLMFTGDAEVIQLQRDITEADGFFLLDGWWVWWGVSTAGQVEGHVRLLWFRAATETEVELSRIGPHHERPGSYDYTRLFRFPRSFLISPGDYIKVELVCVRTGGEIDARCHARGGLYVDSD